MNTREWTFLYVTIIHLVREIYCCVKQKPHDQLRYIVIYVCIECRFFFSFWERERDICLMWIVPEFIVFKKIKEETTSLCIIINNILVINGMSIIQAGHALIWVGRRILIRPKGPGEHSPILIFLWSQSLSTKVYFLWDGSQITYLNSLICSVRAITPT